MLLEEMFTLLKGGNSLHFERNPNRRAGSFTALRDAPTRLPLPALRAGLIFGSDLLFTTLLLNLPQAMIARHHRARLCSMMDELGWNTYNPSGESLPLSVDYLSTQMPKGIYMAPLIFQEMSPDDFAAMHDLADRISRVIDGNPWTPQTLSSATVHLNTAARLILAKIDACVASN